ncbi:MAG: pyruvate formate lyase-activating protein, partial [Thaumarchaeota archaeon]|nr:pyruvate formate lyase-activating protein [Nitrososphaerota archaeon]
MLGGEENLPNIKLTPLQESLSENKARCLICERKCILEEGKRGFCKTKMNIRGKIYTVVYGDISALESRPIEIKP